MIKFFIFLVFKGLDLPTNYHIQKQSQSMICVTKNQMTISFGLLINYFDVGLTFLLVILTFFFFTSSPNRVFSSKPIVTVIII